jgi:hypothetical protein
VRIGRVTVLASLISAFVLAAPVAAAAQSASIYAFGNGAHVIRQIGLAGSVSGQVVVSFRGDPASGCRALGVCEYSGTVIWNPGRSVDLEVAKLRVHKRIEYTAFASFGIGPSSDESTTARVQRNIDGRPAGRCDDAEPQAGTPSTVVRERTFTLQLFAEQGSLLTTRCAGPRDGELAAAGPRVMLPVGRLLRGQRLLDLREARSFAARGFTGTVISTVMLRLGKPRNAGNNGAGGFPPGIKRVRTRIVTEHLSRVGVRGNVTASFQGSSDADLCSLLDSCGLVGTTTLDPISRSPQGYLYASGPATLPYRAFLVALGLRRGSPPAAIRMGGGVSWEDDGSAHEQLTAPNRCSDVARLGAGFATIDSRRTRLLLSYNPAEPPTTECPGPNVAALGSGLLSGSMPRTTLSSRPFTLVLRRGSSLRDDGYTGSVRGSLRLTLRRGRVTQQVITEPQ